MGKSSPLDHWPSFRDQLAEYPDSTSGSRAVASARPTDSSGPGFAAAVHGLTGKIFAMPQVLRPGADALSRGDDCATMAGLSIGGRWATPAASGFRRDYSGRVERAPHAVVVGEYGPASQRHWITGRRHLFLCSPCIQPPCYGSRMPRLVLTAHPSAENGIQPCLF